MTKSTGVWKLATTVAPGSMLRVTTTPSTGAIDLRVPEVARATG